MENGWRVVYVSPNGNGLYTVKWAQVRPRTLNGHQSTNLNYRFFVVAFPTLWHIHTYIYVHTYIYIHIFSIYMCVCVFFYTLRLLLLLFQMFPYEFRCGLYIWYKCVFYSILVPGLVWSPNCTWNVPLFFPLSFPFFFFFCIKKHVHFSPEALALFEWRRVHEMSFWVLVSVRIHWIGKSPPHLHMSQQSQTLFAVTSQVPAKKKKQTLMYK